MTYQLPKNRLWLSQAIVEPKFDDSGGQLFYIRMADGRRSLVRQDLATGNSQVVTAEPAPSGNVGYGGGSYDVRGDLVVYAAKGKLIRLDLTTGEQRSLTPEYEGVAVPTISLDGRYVAFVVELEGHSEVFLTDTAGEYLPIKLSKRPDFAANPVFSPDGKRIAWMEWQANRMPWDEARLQIAELATPTGDATAPGALLPLSLHTLSKPDVSYANPQFSLDGSQLAFTSDETGWRSIYIADADGSNAERLDTGQGEVGFPDWQQGQFAVRWGAGGIYAIRRYRSRATLIHVSLPDRACHELPSRYTAFGELQVYPGDPDQLAYLASSPRSPSVLVTREKGTETVRASTSVGLLDAEGLTDAEIVEWPTTDGTEVWGILYRGRSGEGPRPLMVVMHGGPTSEVSNGWNATGQYYSGKGWHVLFVNYRGSTGSGREYQDKLQYSWGVADIEDARTGAEHLVEQGLADQKRVVITGGSAGGYSTLQALARQPEFWTAGVSLFGIGNLYECRIGSHRFEALYEDTLIGPLPETAERWVERSPLTYVEDVRAPVLLFHGKEDNVVPYQQSVEFADAVKARGGTAELVLYDDEGHGFRKEANRKDNVEKTDAFLEKYVINLQGAKPRKP